MSKSQEFLGVAGKITLGVFFLMSLRPAFGKIDVIQTERSGSRLVIDLKSDEEVRWVLRDGANGPGDFPSRVCSQGTAGPGFFNLIQDKVSSSTDLEFVVFDRQGKLLLQETYLGAKRASPLKKPEGAVRIYQLEVRTYFAKGLGPDQQGRLEDLTLDRLRDLAEFGVDYLWLTGVLEHGTQANSDADVVKGEAGSYYAIVDHWDVEKGLGDLNEFDALIERAHNQGLRVLLDLVPNHTARSPKTDVVGKCRFNFGANDRTFQGFSTLNNFYYLPGQAFTPPWQSTTSGQDGSYDTDLESPGIQVEFPAKATGNDVFIGAPSRDDWYETSKLNYGWDYQAKIGFYDPIPVTWFQIVDIGKYWLAKGVDGFRVDFAHSVPIEFWRYFVRELRSDFPNAFLVAEAYESDLRMKLPGFSYKNLLEAGFDTVYESSAYWKMRGVAERPGTMSQTGLPGSSWLVGEGWLSSGLMPTRYMENHDEIRLASRFFSPSIDSFQRSQLGLAMTAYLGLLPGHLLVHGGQEFGEDASIFGQFAGDNGRTSIFDFVYQEKVKNWLQGQRQDAQVGLWGKYASLLRIKSQIPFSMPDKKDQRTFIDLMGINLNRPQSQWVSAYVRYSGEKRFIVVTNTDPVNDHEVTLHLTQENDRDSEGILKILGISNNDKRWRFRDLLFHPAWESRARQVPVMLEIPGWVLFQSQGVPSGFYLGMVPKASTLVLEVDHAP